MTKTIGYSRDFVNISCNSFEFFHNIRWAAQSADSILKIVGL